MPGGNARNLGEADRIMRRWGPLLWRRRVARYSIGLDFGTQSVRAVVVGIGDGAVAGQATVAYEHDVIDRTLPGPGGVELPPDYALQDPLDWINGAGEACRAAMSAS